MEYKDYYQIMGVERNATQDEIKHAYRKLARKYHPDVSKETDAEQRFKEVGEAKKYSKTRKNVPAYDQLGANWKSGQDFNAPPDWDAGFEFGGGGFTGGYTGGGDGHSFNFQQAGDRPGGYQQQAGFQPGGSDHHAKILIDLEDAMNGATRSISLRVPDVDAGSHVTTKMTS